jgi:phosphoserine aminotransferase
MTMPQEKPANPKFSSGPTTKFPGWTLNCLSTESLGRSHRATAEKAKLNRLISDSKSLLGIPEDYVVGIVPGSDTGAFELAMWNLLGQRGVEILSWESFGQGWLSDIKNQLGLTDITSHSADYGQLPDLSKVDCNRDVVFTWNGTTSGVRVPNGDWISNDREGLTLCDATSAVFAMDMPWEKLDVTTWSWQKVLGGEGGQGMIALSPRAVERLEQYAPAWPLPKIFRLTKSGKLIGGIFKGATINTPSMLAVEDQIEALSWASSIGKLPGLIKRSLSNLNVVEQFVESSEWLAFLCEQDNCRSSTSICLKIEDPWFTNGTDEEQREVVKKICSLLESEDVAYDIGGHRDAPPGLRIWGGATVEASDIKALMPWLNWAYASVKDQ